MADSFAILRHGCRWIICSNPSAILHTFHAKEVRSLLEEIEQACGRGYLAAGYLAYEAAPGFDSALVTKSLRNLPLAWFGLYRTPRFARSLPPGGPFRVSAWRPELSHAAYLGAIKKIRRYIVAGDTYQVNYTFRMHADCEGDPLTLFRTLAHAQQAPYAAFLQTDTFAIASASPELFLRLQGYRVWSRPMKGTSPRGRTTAEDDAQAHALARSPKNRAENLMIVDMVRNDLGRIARPGTVHATRLCDVERYPTVLQMTSTVTARTDARLSDILAATFPCASITGAPKVRTMEIIRELERSPRGCYTGTIGWMRVGGHPIRSRHACFNVAIRTVVVDRQQQQAEYGTGGGIVWDSRGDPEYQECRTKAQVLITEYPEFRLVERILWTPARGFFLLRRHLRRLADSARYFNFRLHRDDIRCRLMRAAARLPHAPHVLRLVVSRAGTIRLEMFPHATREKGRPFRVAWAPEPISRQDVFLYHKTTHRATYDRLRAARPDVDDVLLWNERGEATEFTIGNLVVQLGSARFTPPVTSGLLPGTMRAHLLARGQIRERVICREDLARARAVFLINSVRGWVPVEGLRP